MRTKNKLHELIHSMNKNEKRFFKLYTQLISKDQKQYLLLYEILEEMDSFDSKELDQKIGLDKKRLNNLSIYLKKQILHSLQIYLRNSNDQLQTSDRLFSAQILFHKKRFKEAIKLLESVEKKALEVSNYLVALNAVQLKIKCLHSIIETDQKLNKDLDEYYETFSYYSERLKEENQIKHIYFLLYKLDRKSFLTDDEQNKAFQEFKIKHLDPLKEEDITGVVAKYYYLICLSVFFLNNEDYDSQYQYNQKVYDLALKYPFLKQENRFWTLLVNWLVPIIKSNQKEQFDKVIKELDLLIESNHKDSISLVYWKHERIATFYVENQNYSLPLNLKNNFLQDIKKYKIPVNGLIKLYLWYAIVYLLKFKYSAASEIAQYTLSYNIPSDARYYISMQVLHIILHYELGEYSLQERALSSLRRNLIRNDLMSDSLKQLLHILQKATSINSNYDNKLKHLKNLNQFIIENKNTFLIKRQLIFLDKWIIRKLEIV